MLNNSKKDTVYVVVHQVNDTSKNSTNILTYLFILGILFLVILLIVNWKVIKKLFENVKPKSYRFNIAGFDIEGDIKYTSISQEVAWKIYIELITRVATIQLEPGSGILREALTSLYSAFGILREIIKNAGAELAKEQLNSTQSVASVMLDIMNDKMRPFLSRWHAKLEKYENTKPAGSSQVEHEENWTENVNFREELATLQNGIKEYVIILKAIATGQESKA